LSRTPGGALATAVEFLSRSAWATWRIALLLVLLPALAGCLGSTPERATISEVRVLDLPGGRVLEVTQRLRLSRTMQSALSSGIPLRLAYRIEACGPQPQGARIELRYVALTRSYEMRRSGDPTVRRFGRRSAMMAALDRVRLPLSGPLDDECSGRLAVALDLTSLPTPLRFPAFLKPGEWRLVSPTVTWHADARD
jgi:hypothetical protein